VAKFLNDILREPGELSQSLAFSLGDGRKEMDRAAAIVQEAREIVITGIGSSWHAGMAVQSLFHLGGKLAHLVDASELLHFTPLRAGSVLIVLSRSGKSVEIVKLLDKAAANNVPVIAITNTPDSPLARHAKVVLWMHAAFDHLVSVTMYSALTLVGGLLAANVTGRLTTYLQMGLASMLRHAQESLPGWQQKIERSPWFDPALPTYFLARGGSLASCHETRLLWEEAAKAPASAMTTGGFRHGPQEMLLEPAAIGMWIDERILRDQDLALAADLRQRGATLMLIGSDIPDSAGDLVFSLPRLPAACEGWQFLADIIPAQLASHRMATLRNVDCDQFFICPYVITSEGGLTGNA
jgi:glucosamine--fructose-6-phosphate aminotransferase (isomerizing)